MLVLVETRTQRTFLKRISQCCYLCVFVSPGSHDGHVQGTQLQQPQTHAGARGRVQPGPASGESPTSHRIYRSVILPQTAGPDWLVMVRWWYHVTQGYHQIETE